MNENDLLNPGRFFHPNISPTAFSTPISKSHMKPTIKLGTAKTPDGGEMILYQHDRDFSIKINGHELMNSRQHESV